MLDVYKRQMYATLVERQVDFPVLVLMPRLLRSRAISDVAVSYTHLNYGVVCAVSTLDNIYERFGYHVLDRTLRLCVGTWEGDMNSLSANMLNGIARLVYTLSLIHI